MNIKITESVVYHIVVDGLEIVSTDNKSYALLIMKLLGNREKEVE